MSQSSIFNILFLVQAFLWNCALTSNNALTRRICYTTRHSKRKVARTGGPVSRQPPDSQDHEKVPSAPPLLGDREIATARILQTFSFFSNVAQDDYAMTLRCDLHNNRTMLSHARKKIAALKLENTDPRVAMATKWSRGNGQVTNKKKMWVHVCFSTTGSPAFIQFQYTPLSSFNLSYPPHRLLPDLSTSPTTALWSNDRHLISVVCRFRVNHHSCKKSCIIQSMVTLEPLVKCWIRS